MKIREYRGIEGLVYAEVIKDEAGEDGAYETGPVKALAGTSELSRETETGAETHYYDNMPAVVITSTGSDTVTIAVSAIDNEVLADITGQVYDETTGMFIEGKRKDKYFAIGYKTKKTDGSEMYVWRLKGKFGIPSSTHVTENDGTDANGQEITYTGINTTYGFEKLKGDGCKAINIDTSLGLVDTTDFFKEVQTPDTIKAKAA